MFRRGRRAESNAGGSGERTSTGFAPRVPKRGSAIWRFEDRALFATFGVAHIDTASQQRHCLSRQLPSGGQPASHARLRGARATPATMPGLFRELKGQSSFAGDQAGAGKPRPKQVTKEEAEEEAVVPAPSQVTSASIMKEREEAIRKRTAELLMSKDTRPANAKMDRKMSHIEGVDADLLVKMLRSDGESSDRRQHPQSGHAARGTAQGGALPDESRRTGSLPTASRRCAAAARSCCVPPGVLRTTRPTGTRPLTTNPPTSMRPARAPQAPWARAARFPRTGAATDSRSTR